ncbi:serine/arginine-rich splicing factor 8-like [Camellia sinensis]|uniref:serine/arginine-rich splicing factor 8-like n=1 Tax=Camellia sinensis TaxID=4442 RepID=UPI0010363004|nr:serine/arginine-rich splicing factor 8-like [Camellia sinensis]
MVDQREQGGWIPVVRKQGRHGKLEAWNEKRRSSLFTLFVDNLPEAMHPKSMYTLFTKFGVVRDVFIPNKRRSVTKTRFGFVRFDCPIAAQIAEQKANGLWIDNKALAVKSAIYGKEQAEIKWRQPDHRGKFVVRQDMEVV